MHLSQKCTQIISRKEQWRGSWERRMMVTARINPCPDTTPFMKPVLIDSLLLSHISKASDVGNRKYKAVLIFIAQGAECEAPVFHGDAAAIPVVRRLDGHALRKAGFRVEGRGARAGEPSLSWAAVPVRQAVLVEAKGANQRSGHQ